MREQVVDVNRGTDGRLNILFIVPYTEGARDSEHYLNPDITKVSVTANGSPNRVYNEGITGIDMWREASKNERKQERKARRAVAPTTGPT